MESNDGVSTFGLDTDRPDRGRHDPARSDPDAYEDDDGNSADEIDPKRLVNSPTVDDIRWYYRNGALAPTIVEKPVNDAFKHGFSIDDDDVQSFLEEEIIGPYKRAHRKARRDGFALLWFRLKDTNDEYLPPENVQGIHEVKVLTLDDMTTAKPSAFEEKLSAGNRDNFDARISTTDLEDLDNLRDVADEDPLNDGPVQPSSADYTHPYNRSQFYETTDNGIVISERLDDERFEKPISYLYNRGPEFDPVMIHPDRVFHIAWRRDVDGNVNHDTWGEWEGDSVLRPIIHLLRAVHKGNWSTMQSLFRHSSPLHVMQVPEGAGDEEYNKAREATRNINAKSSITEPPNFELRIEDNETGLDPEPHFNVIFDQICAGTEFTRSVLFGTQSGTVSGSETDIKNYFNKVERLRENRFEPELRSIVNWWIDVSDGRGRFGIANDAGDFEINWGPLFKLSELDRAEAMSRHVQLTTQAASNYILSESEARSLLDEQWADWTDVDIDGVLSDGEKDALDRIDEAADTADADDEMDGNPAVGQNGGGMEHGQQTASEQPNSN